MKRRTKAKKQKLNNLLILLVLTAMLLIMSTYAWFIANKTVSVEGININVTTSSGLQISADGAEWTTRLDSEMLKKATKDYPTTIVNQLPKFAAPVSTVLNVEGNYMEMFYGEVTDALGTGEYILTSKKQEDKPAEAGETGKYVAFDIFLKSGNSEENFYMSGKVEEQEKDSEGYFRTATTIKGIENAARIAIIPGGNTSDIDTPTTIRGLGTSGEALLWEPNCDTHTSHAIAYANDYLGLSLSTAAWVGTNKDPIDYDGIKTEFLDTSVFLKKANATDNSAKFEKVTPKWQTGKAETSPNNPMPPYSDGKALLAGVTRYRVYMWVEGQDIDCEDHASGTYLRYDLKFSLEPFTP